MQLLWSVSFFSIMDLFSRILRGVCKLMTSIVRMRPGDRSWIFQKETVNPTAPVHLHDDVSLKFLDDRVDRYSVLNRTRMLFEARAIFIGEILGWNRLLFIVSLVKLTAPVWDTSWSTTFAFREKPSKFDFPAKPLLEREWIFEYIQSYCYVRCSGSSQQQGNKSVNASDKSSALGHNEKNIWDRWRMCWQTSKLRH